MRGNRWSWLLLASSVFGARAASAQPDAAPLRVPDIEIAWTAPAECPTRVEVRAEVVRLIEAVAKPSPVARSVSARATVTVADHGYALELLVDADGARDHRSIDGEACADLADAAALIVAMAYDPEVANVVAPPPEPAPAPEPDNEPLMTPEPEPVPDEPAQPEALPEPPPSEVEIHPLVGLAGTLGVGMLPTATLGGSFQAGLSVWRLRFVLDASAWLSRSALVEGGVAGGEISLQSFGLGACGQLAQGSLEVYGCGRLDVGRMRARGFGVDRPQQADAAWVAVGPGAVLSLPMTRWLATQLELAAMFPLTRPHWLLEGVGQLPDPGVVSLRMALGMEIRF